MLTYLDGIPANCSPVDGMSPMFLTSTQSAIHPHHNRMTLADVQQLKKQILAPQQQQQKPIAPTTSTIAIQRSKSPDSVIADMTKAQVKRMKNTEAARQSRRRKLEHLRTLESQIKDLEECNRTLERENAVVRTENNSYARRIESLERQVDELHNLLLAFGSRQQKIQSNQLKELPGDEQ